MSQVASTFETFTAVRESPITPKVWFRTAHGSPSQKEGRRKTDKQTLLLVPGQQKNGWEAPIIVIDNFVQEWRYAKTLRPWNVLKKYSWADDDMVEVIIFEFIDLD